MAVYELIPSIAIDIRELQHLSIMHLRCLNPAWESPRKTMRPWDYFIIERIQLKNHFETKEKHSQICGFDSNDQTALSDFWASTTSTSMLEA